MDQVTKIVEYDKTKNHYVVLSDGKALMKNQETGEWARCVIYSQYKNINEKGEYIEIPEEMRMIFVREYTDFWNKFSLCLDL
jgi:hypothetical protein